MTEGEVQKMEAELSVKLPQAYRDAICPFPVRAYVGNADTDLWDDPAKLIELNRCLHVEQGWPDNLFAVGEDGGGTQTAVDLATSDLRVWWTVT